MDSIVIKDDVYMEIDDEFEQIRTALGMYISKLGTEGAEHLIKELTNNAFDECVNPEALSTEFEVYFDEVEQSFMIVDHSRGIPFDKMVDVCTKKHTSTKFIREGEKMKEQCGRNGVGMVVTSACSKYFSMQSYRGNESKKVTIVDGEILEDSPMKLKKPRHGLTVKFIPSSEYLKGDVNLECHRIEDYFRRMSYIMRGDIKITLYEFAKDIDPADYEELKPSHTYHYSRQGLSEDVRYLSSSLEFTPVEIISITDDFDLEVAFSYDKTLDTTVVDSYCNYVNTTEGGNHEVVALRAICDFFCREAKKLDPNAKYEVTFEDCKKGLIYCVNCKHIDPAYEGQHKSRVSNADVLKTGKKGLTDALYKYFNVNNSLLRRIVSYLRMIAKIRVEAHKIKGTVIKKQTSFLDDNEIPLWYPLADRNYSGYKELIIAEGESAAVAIDTARNSKFQAVFGVMGVVNNVHGKTPLQVFQECKVFRNLITILGTDIGPKFDITKLKYDKIILEADADIDGNNITSLILLFIVLCMPELIFQGKIYKALPPLLILNSKTVNRGYGGSLYLYTREEYYNVINKIIADNTSLALPIKWDSKDVVPLKKKGAKDWLSTNVEYTTELTRLKARTSCEATAVLEIVCFAKLISNGDDEKMQKVIKTELPEIVYDVEGYLLDGSYKGQSVSLIIDDIFWRAAKKILKIMSQNDTVFVYAKNKNDATDTYDRFTIGDFLYKMDQSYSVKIDQRYKGIGEMDAKVIFATTLNPKVRKLIRFNIDDMDKTLEIFNLLHGKNADVRQKRRELLDNSEISYMDLDN